MFALLKDPHFDFMGKRNVPLAVSLILVLACCAVLAIHGLNRGIEFTGGNELQVRFAEKPDIGAIRSLLSSAGMTSQVVTTIGDPSENEVYIRLAASGDEQETPEDLAPRVLAALRGGEDRGHDLNVLGEQQIAVLLEEAPGVSPANAEGLAAAILEKRKELAIFHSFDDLAEIAGMTPEVLDDLRGRSSLGSIALRSQSYIGPAIGRELRNKALMAIVGSLIGMLIYIWIRFQLYWGFAAVVALAHDTLITLGLFSLFGKEMSLPVVAAFLTLVGYSVNDTVVVFDRIRENLQSKRVDSFESIVNMSINQTLSRTVITSGLTWIVVFGLFLFGGQALNPFAFVLSVGVLVGTYSSIYVASPFLVLWQNRLRRRHAADGGERASGGQQRVKKVRGGSSAG